jgi:hypothetical protein
MHISSVLHVPPISFHSTKHKGPKVLIVQVGRSLQPPTIPSPQFSISFGKKTLKQLLFLNSKLGT